ncbi:MAG TPA: transcriptional regulator [Sphingomicrobium sp.]|nr:transcriptional regulator [Sphingomicrobium sp.]
MRGAGESFRFGRFVVDVGDRRLLRDGEPQDIGSRYFDALLLLVGQRGRLVSRERLLDEVWKGVPVTDEALSQCIAQLRRVLGDDPGRPLFIETVPKHGYRFVAEVEAGHNETAEAPHRPASDRVLEIARFALAGVVGGAMAGIFGGLLYGLGATPDPLHQTVGSASFLLVMLAVNMLAAAIGGLGVATGIGVAHRFAGQSPFSTLCGAAAGGLLVGTAVRLLAADAFTVLLGRAPDGMGGGLEGLLLGAAVGLGLHFPYGRARRWPSVSGAAAAGFVAGAILPLLGGRLMGSSLDSLADTFPGSPLNIDALGRWFGEDQLGLVSQVGLTAFEGLTFGAVLALAIRLLVGPRTG